jgi:hypothetical protein
VLAGSGLKLPQPRGVFALLSFVLGNYLVDLSVCGTQLRQPCRHELLGTSEGAAQPVYRVVAGVALTVIGDANLELLTVWRGDHNVHAASTSYLVIGVEAEALGVCDD